MRWATASTGLATGDARRHRADAQLRTSATSAGRALLDLPRARSSTASTCRGGLAEYVRVQAQRAFRVPADLDAALAALAEPMAVVVHGLRRGGLAPGSACSCSAPARVGLLTVLAARALGAGEVWISARHPHQAELARALRRRRAC